MVQFDSFGATGITGLSVGADTFDVTFPQGFYSTVFPDGDVFSFAGALVPAITDALNLAGNPLLSTAAGGLFPFIFAVPYAHVVDSLNILAYSGSCGFSGSIFIGFPCGTPWAPDVDAGGDLVTIILPSSTSTFWANPTLAPVPLPAALPLFGSALAMLGIFGWRRKRRAAA